MSATVWAVTIGNFDGIHKGHRNLIEKCLQWKRLKHNQNPELNIKIKVITFDPHPVEFLRPGTWVSKLCSKDEKITRLVNSGVDHIQTLTFDRQLASLSAVDFLNQTLRDSFKTGFLVVGENFRFGFNRTGDVDLLRNWCKEQNVECEIAPILKSDGDVVSSSRIRQLIESGQMVTCARLLGTHYSITGTVVHGDKRGRLLGFPTANVLPVLAGPERPCIPQKGVYLSNSIVEGQTFASITNVGVKPTVSKDGAPLVIETHLIDFEGDLYGKRLTVEFLDRLRDEKRFSSIDELKQQIQQDTLVARQRLRFV